MTAGTPPDTLELVVDEVTPLTPHITAFWLRAPDHGVLPGFTAGAHIRVEVHPQGVAQWRHYSLINFDGAPAALQAPRAYQIAVRREDDGQGGSRWMHAEVRAGQTLRVLAPTNAFALQACDDAVLIAGGIGITPIASMATELAARGHRFALHYSGRSASQLVFVDELRTVAGEQLHVYGDDDPACRFDLPRLLDGLRPAQPLHVCGPKGMIDAAIALATERGWPRERIHVELFAAAEPQDGDAAFDVELRQSGNILHVGPEQTILQAMIDAGLDPLYDCQRGECGVCQTGVIEGEIDHRDYCLSDSEKREGKVMQICVSRARGKRLVLDA